jgi:hypothetical protein
MSDQNEKSDATRRLDENPELRKAMSESESFRKFKESHKSVIVDDAKYYVVGGDMLLDEDELYLYNLQQEAANQEQQTENNE